MRMNRFSVLIGILLCPSGNDRSFAAENGDANENIASTPTREEAAIQAAAYKARLAARADADAIAQAQLLTATMPASLPASSTSGAGKSRTYHASPLLEAATMEKE